MDSMESIESRFSSGGSGGSYVSQNSDLSSQQARLREQMDQRLSCPVCLERFSDPRLLECNHSFCRRCLVDVLHKRPKCLEEDGDDDKRIDCPKCRFVTHLGDGGIDALPSNYALNDLLEILPEDSSSFPSTPVAPFRPFPVSIPMCDEHQRQLEFFCETDDVLVCADCLVMPEHRGHNTVAAKQILGSELEKLRISSFENAEKMLLKVREAVDSVSNMADALKEKGEKTKARVQVHFREIRDALEVREQSLLNTTEEIIMRKVTKLDKQKVILMKSREDLEIKVMNLKRILDHKEDYSFLKHKRKLIADVAQAVERAQSKDRVPMESTKDGPDCSLPDDLLTQARTFGEVYCRPCPAKFTARGEGLSKGFIGKVAQFRVEARDRYGRRSVVSGSTIKVHIQGPSHTIVQAHIEEAAAKGEYFVSYTPSVIGYHLIRITADGVKIQNSDLHVVMFNKTDYSSIDMPQQHISKLRLRVEPPVAIMRSVCILPSGHMVFTDAFCLRIVDPATEQVVRTVGSFGTGNGQFSLPLGLAVNKAGAIFVSDSTNHRIQRFTSDGRHALTFAAQGSRVGFLNFPEGLAVLGEDKLYVADCGNDRIQIFSQKNGKYLSGFGKKGPNAGQFVSPRYIAVDMKNSRILVSDTGNFRVQALTLDGRPLTQFGHPKGGSVYLSYPYFITVDEDGFILVTETKLHYVTVLTPRGALVRHFGSHGDAPGQFRTPYGICLNPTKKQVIVTDSTSHCIQIF